MVGIKSDVGVVRSLNEDYAGYIEEPRYRLYVVADGMGGHNAGEVASKIAVDTVKAYVRDNYENVGSSVLENAVSFANLLSFFFICFPPLSFVLFMEKYNKFFTYYKFKILSPYFFINSLFCFFNLSISSSISFCLFAF